MPDNPHKSDARGLISSLPKAELHIHLEGSIQAHRLKRLAERHGVTLGFDPTTLASRTFYADLDEFLAIFTQVTALLRSAEDFADVVADLGEDAARQNIIYREVMFTPTYYAEGGPSLDEILAGLRAGRDRCLARHGVLINFIADIDRSTDPAAALALVHELAALDSFTYVRAIGMDGAERDVDPTRLREALMVAHDYGFHLTSHLGSDEGPAAIKRALAELPLARIDHGIRCVEDEDLLRRIVKRRMPMTVCPMSNLAVYPDRYPRLDRHPLRRLVDAGARITLNSDDPGMFAGDLVENFVQAAHAFSLSNEEIIRIMRTAFDASFAEPGNRHALLLRFDEATEALRRPLR